MQKTKKLKKLVVANWKMNPKTNAEALTILKETLKGANTAVDVTVCPPFLFLSLLAKIKLKKGITLGLQNVSEFEEGAHTGEVSVLMGKNFPISYVIVGHSERRAIKESDEVVAKKVLAVKKAKLTPIVCIGEHERDQHGLYLDAIKKQLLASLALLPKAAIKEIVVAYEPIWAIGKSASEAMDGHTLHQTSLLIRKILIEQFGSGAKETRILYGGAVAPENAALLVKEGEVDGLLVGHQSLKPKAFGEIIMGVSHA